jgi:hypothetical protein
LLCSRRRVRRLFHVRIRSTTFGNNSIHAAVIQFPYFPSLEQLALLGFESVVREDTLDILPEPGSQLLISPDISEQFVYLIAAHIAQSCQPKALIVS